MRIIEFLSRSARYVRSRGLSPFGKNELPAVTLVGHPYAPTGRGEHLRAIWRALRAAGVRASICNLTESGTSDPAFHRFKPHMIQTIPAGVRIFHVNGGEVEETLRILQKRQPGFLTGGFNIVFPAWELSKYPEALARNLEKFDEIWTASGFVEAAIRAAVSVPIVRIPNACEPHLLKRYSRAHFGLPRRCWLILFLFDMWSLHSRKNPLGAIEAFRRALAARPSADIHLVLKVGHPEADLDFVAKIREAIEGFGDRATLLEGTWSADEARSLIRCSDCFLSLHRSEGFGRGPAEAMFFGKPVVATGWSGNMEYMNEAVAFLVGYELTPVQPGEFSDWQDQVWADPDISNATAALVRTIDDRAHAMAVGKRARGHMRKNFSDAVLGSLYRTRIAEIANARGMLVTSRGRHRTHAT